MKISPNGKFRVNHRATPWHGAGCHGTEPDARHSSLARTWQFLLCSLFLCALATGAYFLVQSQHPHIVAPSAPWDNCMLDFNNAESNGDSHGGFGMGLYENSSGGFSDGSLNESFSETAKVIQLKPDGCILDVRIEGQKTIINNKPVNIHFSRTVWVPYGKDQSVPVIDGLQLEIHFQPIHMSRQQS